MRTFKTLRKSFLRDRRGATAVVFGLTLVTADERLTNVNWLPTLLA